jgi:sterol 24-C-methyltransferase
MVSEKAPKNDSSSNHRWDSRSSATSESLESFLPNHSQLSNRKDLMNVAHFLEQTRNSQTRTDHYLDLVKEYYENISYYYQQGWGDCFHHAPFKGGESREEAMIEMHRRLIRETGISAGMKVLDVGCGIGGPARSIAQLSGADVTGINISPTQLEVARVMTAKQKLQDRVHFELVDAMHMPFLDGSFDVVYLTESGCHMPDKLRFYREIVRVLKSGGVFAGWDWVQTKALDDDTYKKYIEPICQYFACPNLITLDQLRAMLGESGLKVKKFEDLGATGREDRPWWSPVEDKLQNPLAKISAKVSSVLRFLADSGYILIEAGKAGVFTPLVFFVAEKE